MRTARLGPRDVEYAEPSFGSLPERMALDLSVANLEPGRPGVTILITASPSAAREVMWRVAAPVVIVAHGTESERSIRKGLASEVDRDRGTTISTIEGFDPLASRPVERVLWLRPTRAILDAGVALIDRAAQDSALVAVVGSGPLDRWRVGARVRFRRSDSAVDPFDVARILGFSTEQEWRVLAFAAQSTRPWRSPLEGLIVGISPTERKLGTGFRSSNLGRLACGLLVSGSDDDRPSPRDRHFGASARYRAP